MPASRFNHTLTTGMLALLAVTAGASVYAQQPSPPQAPSASSAPAAASASPGLVAEPVDTSGQACGNVRALPADVTHYRYEVKNRCQRPITYSWRCNSADTEHSLDVAGQATEVATCVKATGAAGEIIFHFGPPGTGN